MWRSSAGESDDDDVDDDDDDDGDDGDDGMVRRIMTGQIYFLQNITP